MQEKTNKQTILSSERLIAQYLFKSDFYNIKSWAFDMLEEGRCIEDYNDMLCFTYIHRGNLLFEMWKDQYDLRTGHIILDKPNFKYKVRPCCGECTIFNFTNSFYTQLLEDLNLKHTLFFSNNNIASIMLNATAECEYLFHQVMQRLAAGRKAEIDHLVLELFIQIVRLLSDKNIDDDFDLKIRSYHFATIERAKEYMNANFSSDISLQDISTHSCSSLFHFSRIFKKLTSYSPHQYLLNLRLKHGEMLLKNSSLPIYDISAQSGFGTAEHFATTFKQKYKLSPSKYREKFVF